MSSTCTDMRATPYTPNESKTIITTPWLPHAATSSHASTHQQALIGKCTQANTHQQVYTSKCTQASVHKQVYTSKCTQASVHTQVYTRKCTQTRVHKATRRCFTPPPAAETTRSPSAASPRRSPLHARVKIKRGLGFKNQKGFGVQTAQPPNVTQCCR